ncbi:MAG: squalene/phytoene synthase family protein [Deltaproteobacteria bacterium]|nr:squalene/phytoene synthase family protein [Deltaproteobacteria bacterium]
MSMKNATAQKRAQNDPPALEIPPGGPWTVEKSIAYCVEMARQEPENTPLAYWFVPNALRPHLATVYAYTRMTHDFGADPRFEAEREEQLAAWEAALLDAADGKAQHPVLVSLKNTIDQYKLPMTPFTDQIVGARMNMRVRRYTNFQQLMTYIEKATFPIGRVILHMGGSDQVEHVRAADDIMTAMQLNTFWTHLSRDFERGRIYIPEEDLRRFGVTESDLKQRRLSREFRALMDFEIQRTRMYLKRGQPLRDHLPKTMQTELQVLLMGVEVALDNIIADKCDVFTQSHALKPKDWARAVARFASWRVKELTQW